ncbi:MAG: lysophospholipid acyltransferase family protein [Candidatus Hydrogenedentes bacterium]|nr:lysophospholipid acyltransferase family protein [Candidatus Hydrogenedentota bacterium]
MRYSLFDTPVVTPLLRLVSNLYLWVMGWHKVGALPADPRCVVVAAPHTSSWDFPLMLACVFSYRAKASWMGKKSMFVWPISQVLKWLGGIPIDRGRTTNAVGQAARVITESDRMLMFLSAEGTRGRTSKWKTGFYHIALKARVPIVLSFADYGRRRVGFGPSFVPTGDIENDMKLLAEFYRDMIPKYPEKFTVPDVSQP